MSEYRHGKRHMEKYMTQYNYVYKSSVALNSVICLKNNFYPKLHSLTLINL